jgi:hypothetical protein
MSRQARHPSIELSTNHFSYEALQKAEWKQFERFTVDILQRYYRPYGLSIMRTIKGSGGDMGSDGSRDGEGTVLFGGGERDLMSSATTSMVQTDLGVLITLWVEVKQRSKGNINHHDVGGTIFRSSLEYVTKIIFVSNRGFTEPFRQHLERYAIRNGKQFGLIDGETLIGIAERVLSKKPEKVRKRHPRQAKSTQAISARLHLAIDPTLRYSDISPGKLECSLNEPIFVIAECDADPLAEIIERPSIELDYVGPGELSIIARSGRTHDAVGAGEHVRAVFAVFPAEPIELSLKSFNLRIVDGDGRAQATKVARRRDSCVVHSNILPNWIPPSKVQIYQRLRSAIDSWARSGGNSAADVFAIAGAGKSHLIRETRPAWLGLGTSEVFLDGGREQTANETALSILSQVFPIPMDEVTSEMSKTLAEWLSRTGLTDDHAATLAHHLCSPSDENSLPFKIPPAWLLLGADSRQEVPDQSDYCCL